MRIDHEPTVAALLAPRKPYTREWRYLHVKQPQPERLGIVMAGAMSLVGLALVAVVGSGLMWLIDAVTLKLAEAMR